MKKPKKHLSLFLFCSKKNNIMIFKKKTQLFTDAIRVTRLGNPINNYYRYSNTLKSKVTYYFLFIPIYTSTTYISEQDKPLSL